MKKLHLLAIIPILLFIIPFTSSQIQLTLPQPTVPDNTYSVIDNFWIAGTCFQIRSSPAGNAVDCSPHEAYIEAHKQEFFTELQTKTSKEITEELMIIGPLGTHITASNYQNPINLLTLLFLSKNDKFKADLEIEGIKFFGKNDFSLGEMREIYDIFIPRVNRPGIRNKAIETIKLFSLDMKKPAEERAYKYQIDDDGILILAKSLLPRQIKKDQETFVYKPDQYPELESLFTESVQTALSQDLSYSEGVKTLDFYSQGDFGWPRKIKDGSPNKAKFNERVTMSLVWNSFIIRNQPIDEILSGYLEGKFNEGVSQEFANSIVDKILTGQENIFSSAGYEGNKKVLAFLSRAFPQTNAYILGKLDSLLTDSLPSFYVTGAADYLDISDQFTRSKLIDFVIGKLSQKNTGPVLTDHLIGTAENILLTISDKSDSQGSYVRDLVPKTLDALKTLSDWRNDDKYKSLKIDGDAGSDIKGLKGLLQQFSIADINYVAQSLMSEIVNSQSGDLEAYLGNLAQALVLSSRPTISSSSFDLLLGYVKDTAKKHRDAVLDASRSSAGGNQPRKILLKQVLEYIIVSEAEFDKAQDSGIVLSKAAIILGDIGDSATLTTLNTAKEKAKAWIKDLQDAGQPSTNHEQILNSINWAIKKLGGNGIKAANNCPPGSSASGDLIGLSGNQIAQSGNIILIDSSGNPTLSSSITSKLISYVATGGGVKLADGLVEPISSGGCSAYGLGGAQSPTKIYQNGCYGSFGDDIIRFTCRTVNSVYGVYAEVDHCTCSSGSCQGPYTNILSLAPYSISIQSGYEFERTGISYVELAPGTEYATIQLQGGGSARFRLVGGSQYRYGFNVKAPDGKTYDIVYQSYVQSGSVLKSDDNYFYWSGPENLDLSGSVRQNIINLLSGNSPSPQSQPPVTSTPPQLNLPCPEPKSADQVADDYINNRITLDLEDQIATYAKVAADKIREIIKGNPKNFFDTYKETVDAIAKSDQDSSLSEKQKDFADHVIALIDSGQYTELKNFISSPDFYYLDDIFPADSDVQELRSSLLGLDRWSILMEAYKDIYKKEADIVQEFEASSQSLGLSKGGTIDFKEYDIEGATTKYYMERDQMEKWEQLAYERAVDQMYISPTSVTTLSDPVLQAADDKISNVQYFFRYGVGSGGFGGGIAGSPEDWQAIVNTHGEWITTNLIPGGFLFTPQTREVVFDWKKDYPWTKRVSTAMGVTGWFLIPADAPVLLATGATYTGLMLRDQLAGKEQFSKTEWGFQIGATALPFVFGPAMKPLVKTASEFENAIAGMSEAGLKKASEMLKEVGIVEKTATGSYEIKGAQASSDLMSAAENIPRATKTAKVFSVLKDSQKLAGVAYSIKPLGADIGGGDMVLLDNLNDGNFILTHLDVEGNGGEATGKGIVALVLNKRFNNNAGTLRGDMQAWLDGMETSAGYVARQTSESLTMGYTRVKYNPVSGALQYATGGSNRLYKISGDGTVKILEIGNLPLGAGKAHVFKTSSLEEGDVLVSLSDGIIQDAFGLGGGQSGLTEEQVANVVRNVVKANSGKPEREIADAMIKEARKALRTPVGDESVAVISRPYKGGGSFIDKVIKTAKPLMDLYPELAGKVKSVVANTKGLTSDENFFDLVYQDLTAATSNEKKVRDIPAFKALRSSFIGKYGLKIDPAVAGSTDWIQLYKKVEYDINGPVFDGRGRFYLNAKDPDSAAEIIKAIAQRSDESGFGFIIKTRGEPSDYARFDNTVLYVESADIPEAKRIVRELAESHPELFNDAPVAFAKKVARGVVAGEQPRSQYYSFNSIRSNAIADTIKKAQKMGITDTDQITAMVFADLEKFDINPQKPWLRASTKSDIFEVLPKIAGMRPNTFVAEDEIIGALGKAVTVEDGTRVFIGEEKATSIVTVDNKKYIVQNLGKVSQSLQDLSSELAVRRLASEFGLSEFNLPTAVGYRNSKDGTFVLISEFAEGRTDLSKFTTLTKSQRAELGAFAHLFGVGDINYGNIIFGGSARPSWIDFTGSFGSVSSLSDPSHLRSFEYSFMDALQEPWLSQNSKNLIEDYLPQIRKWQQTASDPAFEQKLRTILTGSGYTSNKVEEIISVVKTNAQNLEKNMADRINAANLLIPDTQKLKSIMNSLDRGKVYLGSDPEETIKSLAVLEDHTLSGAEDEFVYHNTKLDRVGGISRDGLVGGSPIEKDIDYSMRLLADDIADSLAPQNLPERLKNTRVRRSNSIFASPTTVDVVHGGKLVEYGVKLKVKINPDEALVVDSSMVTGAIGATKADATLFFEDYWKKAVTLREFRENYVLDIVGTKFEDTVYVKKPGAPSYLPTAITAPEVLVPDLVPPENMKVQEYGDKIKAALSENGLSKFTDIEGVGTNPNDGLPSIAFGPGTMSNSEHVYKMIQAGDFDGAENFLTANPSTPQKDTLEELIQTGRSKIFILASELDDLKKSNQKVAQAIDRMADSVNSGLSGVVSRLNNRGSTASQEVRSWTIYLSRGSPIPSYRKGMHVLFEFDGSVSSKFYIARKTAGYKESVIFRKLDLPGNVRRIIIPDMSDIASVRRWLDNAGMKDVEVIKASSFVPENDRYYHYLTALGSERKVIESGALISPYELLYEEVTMDKISQALYSVPFSSLTPQKASKVRSMLNLAIKNLEQIDQQALQMGISY